MEHIYIAIKIKMLLLVIERIYEYFCWETRRDSKYFGYSIALNKNFVSRIHSSVKFFNAILYVLRCPSHAGKKIYRTESVDVTCTDL